MNRMRYVLIFIILIILIGCSTDDITEEDLIGGEWVVTAGYKDGKPEGEPNCTPSVNPGLEFKDEETVYSKGYERDFNYSLEERKEGNSIYLEGIVHRIYYIEKISEDEFGLKGTYNDESCYFKRQ